MFRKCRLVIFSLVIAASPAILFSCGSHRNESNTPYNETECSAILNNPELMGRPVKSLPIDVFIDAAWKYTERDVIIDAINEWNRFSSEFMEKPLFRLAEPQPIDPECIYNLKRVSMFCAKNRRGLWILPEFSETHWRSMGFSNLDLGVTKRCSVGEETGETKIVVVVNRTEDRDYVLKAILLHELGHVLGIKHGCDGNKSSDTEQLMCSSVTESDSQMTSVMSPNFYVTVIEHCTQKTYKSSAFNELQPFDKNRVRCLYGEASE